MNIKITILRKALLLSPSMSININNILGTFMQTCLRVKCSDLAAKTCGLKGGSDIRKISRTLTFYVLKEI